LSNVLVTGAAGFVGSHVIPALLDAGHSVRALVRTESGTRAVIGRLAPEQQRSVTFATGDIGDPASLVRAATGVDAIVHLVAIPRDRNGGRDLERINLGGTRAMIDAARTSGVERFIHLGAMGVRDDPSLHYAQSKARAEAAVRGSVLRWTILKPSLLWGEHDGFFNILASLVRYSPGIVPLPAGQHARYQPLSVDDLARIVATCVDRDDTVGQSYDLGGPDYWTYRDMLQEVIHAMGRRRFLLPMPLPVVKFVARASEALRLPFPVASDQLRQLAFDNAADLDGVPTAFGFQPRPMAGNLAYLRRKLRDQEPARRSSPRTS
jgi:uncharacterized protein YbjT (DUF2867 family)